MVDQPIKPRRRPVDALFGDSDAPTLPSFAVEPPQPVSTVSPPPPATTLETNRAMPAAPTVPPPPVPAAVPPERNEAPISSSIPDVPTFSPPVDAGERTYPSFDTPAVGAPVSSTRTASAAPVALPSARVAPPPESSPAERPASDDYFAYLPETIRQLYEQIHAELSDSPGVADYCMKLLLQARDADIRRDYATAEYYVQAARAKLKHSQQSARVARSPKMLLLWAWELVTLLAFGGLAAITFVPALTLFGVSVSAEMITLLRALAWGGLGGVLGGMYNMQWFIQHREYDPAYNVNYFVRPLLGALLGAILFLLSQAGIIAGNAFVPALPGTSEPTEIPVGPIFLFLFAMLAGFKQESVLDFLGGIVRSVFRRPRAPEEQLPAPPAS